MSDNSIHTALLELESELREIESAREQVLAVSSSGQDLINAFASVLRSLSSLESQFNEREANFADELDKSIEKFRQTAQYAMNDLVDFQKENRNKLTKEMDGIFLRFDEFNSRVDGLSITINSTSERVRALDFNQMLSEVLARMTDFQNELAKKNERKLKDMEDSIKGQIEHFNRKQTKTMNFILIIMVIGFIGLTVFGLLFKN